MENLIPFLIGIAFYIYKTWSNFREEQEKARKRNPSAPATGATQPGNHRRVVRKEPAPSAPVDYRDSSTPYEPQYKETYHADNMKEELEKERALSEKRESASWQEGRNPERTMAEYSPNRKVVKKQQPQVQVEELGPVFEFDMKDAIVKEAILNRPRF